MVSLRKLGRVVVVTAAIPTAALAAKLTALGGNVRLTTDETAVEGCEALGDVVAKPPFVLPDDWQVKLRNAGGDLGATIVWHTKPSIGQVTGKAYRCTAPDTASEPAGPACGKDTDCKGDRICEEGTCKALSK